jgi:hypothetical protein
MLSILERSVAEIRLLELVQNPAQFHQHRPHELLLWLVAQTDGPFDRVGRSPVGSLEYRATDLRGPLSSRKLL